MTEQDIAILKQLSNGYHMEANEIKRAKALVRHLAMQLINRSFPIQSGDDVHIEKENKTGCVLKTGPYHSLVKFIDGSQNWYKNDDLVVVENLG
jgi:hypothetical protein